MIKALIARLRQGHKTIQYPNGAAPELPARFRGLPALDKSKCPAGCAGCKNICPTGAVDTDNGLHIDLGLCLFCGECARACPSGAIQFTNDYRLAVSNRAALVTDGRALELATAMGAELLRLYGRSFKLRQVSAGGCNACEADANVLTTIGWDLGRFGVQFVASPRHADGLLITGPVTQNMKLALEKTYAALPGPRVVIACGACAISGGPYVNHPEANNGAAGIVPVDLFVPGCPPHPLTLLDGLLRLLNRVR